jgi:hypothetical protein
MVWPGRRGWRTPGGAKDAEDAEDARILKDGTSVPATAWHVLWPCGTLTAVVTGAHRVLFPAAR